MAGGLLLVWLVQLLRVYVFRYLKDPEKLWDTTGNIQSFTTVLARTPFSLDFERKKNVRL